MNFSRRSFQNLLIASVVLALPTAEALAASEPVAFTASVFQDAQAAGKPILIEVHASWCPTCKAQKPILDRLTSDARFKDLQVFRVDFDTQKDVVKNFGANMQSTLIAFKGGKETGRSVGDTKEASIAALLDKTL